MATEESLPVPASQPQGFKYKLQRLKKSLTTKEGLIGDYDYGYLFKPNLPFVTKELSQPPFFGLYDYMPWLLATLLGFQHALAMLAGVVTPSLILSSASGVNLPADVQQYLVSTSLIVCGILSAVQITRFRILKTSYHIGTGLISVVGTTFAIIPVATGYFSQMYANGTCKLADDGSRLPCPDAYGAVIGTACVCAFLEIGLAFVPPRILHKIFPPIVTGPTVMLIGASLVQTGFQSWAGGSGPCNTKPADGFFMLCPDIAAPHALPWGSAQFIGLGFLVFVTILLCERFGSPIMRSASVICGLLTGCIVAGATGYFDRSTIDAAPAVSFIWVHTFKLSVSGPLVLPMLMIYLICACEAIGDITATSDVSNLEVEGPQFDSRIQGGVLADGCNSLLAALMTMTPMTTFAQNNGVIALTRCANRKAGYFACFFLIIMGIFSKFAAAFTAIPASVLGGMTTFLFASVAVSGIAIIAREPFTRRNRFILTAALAVGYGATLVPTWFDSVFTYKGDNRSLQGFFDAIVLVLETGFAVTALLAIILNLSISQEPEDSTQLDGKIPAHESEENLESKAEKAVAPKVQDIEIA